MFRACSAAVTLDLQHGPVRRQAGRRQRHRKGLQHFHLAPAPMPAASAAWVRCRSARRRFSPPLSSARSLRAPIRMRGMSPSRRAGRAVPDHVVDLGGEQRRPLHQAEGGADLQVRERRAQAAPRADAERQERVGRDLRVGPALGAERSRVGERTGVALFEQRRGEGQRALRDRRPADLDVLGRPGGAG